MRIVTIEGCDSCACCGTHVAKTGEIRLIKILSAQKYKGGVRVTMLSGEKAYADYCLKHINTLGIARLLSVKPEEAGDAVVRLKQKNIEMKKKSNSSKELYALQEHRRENNGKRKRNQNKCNADSGPPENQIRSSSI